MSYSSRIRLTTCALILTCAPALLAQPLAPQELSSNPSVTALNEEGAALYEQRDYRRAVERFLRAYALDPDPNLLFNIARCYEKLGDRDAAIEKYEEFLSLPGADTQGKSRAHQSLAALKQLSTAELSHENAGAENSASSATDSTADLSSGDTSSASDEASQTSSSIWPWVSLAAGIGAAGVGVTFLVLGQQDHNKLMNAPGYDDRTQAFPFTEPASRTLVESGDQKKLVGTIAASAGGALLLTSALLFLLTDDGPSNTPQVGLSVSQTTANLAISGAF